MNTALRVLSILWMLIAFLRPALPVFAQEDQPAPGGTLAARAPQLDTFPTVHLYMDAIDPAGAFLPGLRTPDVQVVEDGRTLPAARVETQQTGLQIILVWNSGTTLGVTVDGLTELERIRQAMQTWTSSQPTDGPDLFNLATPSGMPVVGKSDPQVLITALADLPPELATGQPTLTSLADSLDLATDTLSDPLMKRVMLYVTPPVSAADTENLPELAGRAREAKLPIYVWQIGPAVDPGVVQPLEQFALDTGGMYFPISPVDALPEIEPLFARSRQMYRVEYLSGVRSSGAHTLVVQAMANGETIRSNDLSFNLTINPPNPIFLDPPTVVKRSWNTPEGTNLKPFLEPDQVELQVMLEFTDQHQRALTATRLFLDGALVAENIAAPFDRFTWDISAETTTIQHTLRVEAVDEFGLTGSSAELPVDLIIDQPAQASLTSRISSKGIVAVAAMVFSGLALAVVLVLTSTQRRGRWKRRRPDKKWLNDPLTQPVAVAPIPARKSKTRPLSIPAEAPHVEPPFPPAARPANGTAPARLVALDENEQPVTGGIILLSRQEMTLGCDPLRATQLLNSPTVDGLHARLIRTEDEAFLLTDNHSIAGTWINYTPVSEQGSVLRHGDILHLGKVSFRFELTDPSTAPAAQVTVTELERAL